MKPLKYTGPNCVKRNHGGSAFQPTDAWTCRLRGFLRSRVPRGLLVVGAGVFALLWLLVRSGIKPSRMSYPCQQSAFSLAVAAFGIPGVSAVLQGRQRLLALLRTGPGIITAAAAGALVVLVVGVNSAVPRWRLGTSGFSGAGTAALVTPPMGYRPHVYVVGHARGIQPGRLGGVDDLITLMGSSDFKWHRSSTIGLTSGPDGLIEPNDVVLIKVNAQWAERGGTNTDVLRGVIRRIVEHPDVFAGEVIVADNGQGSGNLNRTTNNAVDPGQSPQDVVNDFITEGWTVSTWLWDTIRSTPVSEYAAGDTTSGYVVSPTPDPETGVRVSYAKFRSVPGTYISYKYGVWQPESGTYDPNRLVVINMPVLKTHSIYAVTAAVKNHMGVVTQSLSTGSHGSVGFGGLGSVMAEVRVPDLTILDCIWVLARPGMGPSASYALASRRDLLLAGRDPVALDAWAVKFILIPQIVANGYSYSSYASTQNPDNPQSTFRQYLDRSMSELLAAGLQTTNDYTAALVHRWAGDSDEDGDLDLFDFDDFQACLTGPGVPAAPACAPNDADEDGAITMNDFLAFQAAFTGS
jgi:uncharacterized protein (DUF362 family)